ncbi:MAG TPA: SprT-like domain-containing protein, partial [Gemmatimonadales bacterium]|nr:SprT-like domain-containing protein [Gemmatimonadales bacterium]
IAVRVSRRMRARLGHYMSASPSGESAEIVVSRRHIRRHGWEEALHTLLHEMVHQWQAENGFPVDHRGRFRRKAREVGVLAQARRLVRGPATA